ncbi:MAG: hypothetical protein WCF39_09150, partial [Pseudolabrys sp.]
MGPKALFSPSSPRTAAVRLQNQADFGPIPHWNMNNSEPRLWARSRDSTGKSCFKRRGTASRGRNGCGKFLKEIIGNLLGGTIDQALAKL